MGRPIRQGWAAAASEIVSGAPGKWGVAPRLADATPRQSGACTPADHDEWARAASFPPGGRRSRDRLSWKTLRNK